MKSILVIGLGNFGKHLAIKMLELGNEVMVIDKNEERIEELASLFTDAHIGDCRNEAVLRSVGVKNFDICFVTIGKDFQSSLEITSMLSELGANLIVSKSNSDRQSMLLKKIGADETVYAEKEISEKLAIRYNAKNIYDYIPLTPSYSIYETKIPHEWIGKTIGEIDVRNKHNVNIIAVRHNSQFKCMPGANYVFCDIDTVVILGESSDVFKIVSNID